MKEKNWLEAERQILNEVKDRAFQIWDQQGRPTGAAGEAVREKNMRAAEAATAQGDRRRAASTPDRLVFELLVSVTATRRGNTRSEDACTAHEPSRSPFRDQSQPLSRGE